MSNIRIKNCGKISNYESLEAVRLYMRALYTGRLGAEMPLLCFKTENYKSVSVKEMPKQTKGICDGFFIVEVIEK